MRTFRCQSQPAQRRARSSPSSASSSTMSPQSSVCFILSAFLILTAPLCASAPAEFQEATTDQRQLLGQVGAECSSFLSADLKFLTSDVLAELCFLMLVHKSMEMKVRENSKREELQGPAGIRSRGYFLYRPRNGKRTLEYE